MSIELKLSRPSRVYRPGESVEGKIITTLTTPLSYHKILVTVTGAVNLQVRGGVAGVIESLYSAVKPLCIIKKSIEVASSAGKLAPGRTEIPFSFSLSSQENGNHGAFYETFHGGNISIQYLITADIMRGYLHKSLSATLEFIVESDKASLAGPPVSPESVRFYITQDTQKHQLLPELLTGRFRITGKILTECSLMDPIRGELVVEASAVPIRSIDVQLLRIESILAGERIIADTSVIQTTQIADGDVCKSLTLPIYVILPRLLVCPTVRAGPFLIEFQISIVISFQSTLSRLYPKSDLRTPRPWSAMVTLPLRVFRT
ncbi:vacuolar protein sorting-associated protein 26C isoform X2 [Phoenix dactylifera]|uniref:Vacuolar protein sorting-associated protein 26C isoform X2 n=1 Tax=Phoenix dactylifera TaxID=42345 RepID=A0A8B8J1A0_PHODC|nr:vacuolar protein sorting-associated protein 26C isoform X2 [Phoenix dactylifera]